MNISMIGAGNVAWHLGQGLEKAGHTILEVYSRNPTNAVQLCQKLYDAKVKNDLNFSESQAELFLLAISDDALDEIIPQLMLPPNTIIAHTSGSKSIEVFEKINLNYSSQLENQSGTSSKKNGFGIFYPLQTFSKQKKILDFSNIPFCIEGNDELTAKKLFWLAEEISQNVHFVNSAQRKILHIAAVVACNFTNHLLALSKDILDEENLSFELWKPLIQETIQKALQFHPKEMQTGPAKRGDHQVIENHLIYLSKYPEIQKIYLQITANILKYQLEN